VSLIVLLTVLCMVLCFLFNNNNIINKCKNMATMISLITKRSFPNAGWMYMLGSKRKALCAVQTYRERERETRERETERETEIERKVETHTVMV